MASSTPTVRPPRLAAADPFSASAQFAQQQAQSSSGGQQSQQLPGAPPAAPPPSTIATPPSPDQTATGGASGPSQAAPTDLVKAAVKAQTAPKTTTGSQNTLTSETPSVAAPKKTTGLAAANPATASAQYAAGPPAGSPDPGMPNTTPANPYAGIPLIPGDENTISGAQATFGNQQAEGNEAMYRAAMNYGDPTTMSQWGLPVTNPNSALAMAALKAQQQTQADQNARGRSDTLFSSLAQKDLGTIGATQQREDLAGYQKYEEALANFRAAMATDTTNAQTTIGGAQADERQQALNNLSTPDTAAGAAPVPTNNAGTTTAKNSSLPRATAPTKAKKGKGKK